MLSTVVATSLGTLIALAIVRHRSSGAEGRTSSSSYRCRRRRSSSAPRCSRCSSTPPVIQLGFWTVFIAHVMFIVSFIVVTVKARLIGFDRHLEEAAMDLGATS